MAPVKVAFNGMGRIGRLVFRFCLERPEHFEVVHVNEIGTVESTAYLVTYDSIHGKWQHEVEAEGDNLIVKVGDRTVTIPHTREKNPADIDYSAVKPDMMAECTGQHLTRPALQTYFDKGFKKVVVSAPVKDAENPVLNIVVGCNDGLYDPAKDHIVTAASCTTNCLAPVVKVIHEKLGIEKGCITTVHCLTNTQSVIDAPNFKKGDLRRARSAYTSLAPTSTGSATAIALIFPELKGKLNGLAVRVPLTNASLTDCVFNVKKKVTAEEVNALIKEASETYLKGILGYETKPLVSIDYVNDVRSSIVDAPSTQVIDGDMVKIYAWYDNEFGYSARMADIMKMVADSL